jgi:DNA repair exonuclease SbcCD nuclease subunit
VVTGVVKEVSDAAHALKVPVLFAGDFFDSWRPAPDDDKRKVYGPELVNELLSAIGPRWGVIAGNHDLPYHDFNQIGKSMLGTLIQADAVVHLKPGHFNFFTDLQVMAVPFGFPIPEVVNRPRNGVRTLLLCHSYVWCEDHKHAKAEKKTHIGSYENIDCYDCAAFGDNHRGFLSSTRNGTPVLNCGAMIRRRLDEMAYTPSYHVLGSDGNFYPVPLTVPEKFNDLHVEENEDKKVKAKELVNRAAEAKDFVGSLALLEEAGVNYLDALKRHLVTAGYGRGVNELIDKWTREER